MLLNQNKFKIQKNLYATYIHSKNFGVKRIKNLIQNKYSKIEIINHRGEAILNDPFSNKTAAFPLDERDRLHLRGLLPPVVVSMERQAELVLEEYTYGLMELASKSPDPETLKSGVTPSMIRKWRVLHGLQDRDETLFYYLIMKNIEEMAPIIYTPTVGWVCKNYSRMFRRARGMFITAEDKGQVLSIIYNWYSEQVQAIVVTDGSRILGLGDLGIGGLGISIGKLDLYVGAGGFHPKKVMPVVIDVGTNNQALINDPYYLGLKQPRLEGQDYYDLIDEFIASVTSRWPKVLIQFEDFQLKHALTLLSKYRDEFLVFNDDIQGTAAIVLSGMLGALRVQNLPSQEFTKQKFCVIGAGSAGMGVVTMLHQFLLKYGVETEDAHDQFMILDDKGLITTKRDGLSQVVQPFARPEKEDEGLSILETVKKYKPTALIGLSGVGGLFTPDILKAMADQPEGKPPIIFPLSNPTSKAECTAEDAQKYTNGKAIFGSGSPFPDVIFNGERIRSNQTNNVYIYPGLAIGAYLGETRTITDTMIVAASEALVELITPSCINHRSIFPALSTIRSATVHIAARVMEQASREGRLNNKRALKALSFGFHELESFIRREQWTPEYKQLIYHPTDFH